MKLLDEIADIGRDPVSGGYVRYAWTEPELALRDWFRDQATQRGLALEDDGNGNIFAWWGSGPDAVLTGSHLDSVPHGGAYDGPLGVVSALLAIDELRQRGVKPAKPIGIAVFAEEEGSRFGLACLGSRLLTGAVAPDQVDLQGVFEPVGRRQDILDRIGCFVELHIEQGRALQRPVGVASAIWPHGRWRLDFAGEPNHAGTTQMGDRRDPMLTFAFTVLAANKEARLRHAHATIGRVQVAPNATNAIPSSVRAWLDARAPSPEIVDELVEALRAKASERASRDGTTVTMTAESITPAIEFHIGLRDRLARLLDAPILPTGAGHDAGVLSAYVPTAMLFVRNPTGVSHSPLEYAADEDCEAGVTALADVLQDLTC
ncbi:allantoate amidohydrolase [Allorhizocola rhizosphaerae]|uniref:allantoate amidohydrolase n=1 Tax=Allorhizocola rhizosphaerae TaxID=1872709 RepID=UPI000E3C162C|nr:allantoate amidohydrolase [Allorhizocola rhizosphaerae]